MFKSPENAIFTYISASPFSNDFSFNLSSVIPVEVTEINLFELLWDLNFINFVFFSESDRKRMFGLCFRELKTLIEIFEVFIVFLLGFSVFVCVFFELFEVVVLAQVHSGLSAHVVRLFKIKGVFMNSQFLDSSLLKPLFFVCD